MKLGHHVENDLIIAQVPSILKSDQNCDVQAWLLVFGGIISRSRDFFNSDFVTLYILTDAFHIDVFYTVEFQIYSAF